MTNITHESESWLVVETVCDEIFAFRYLFYKLVGVLLWRRKCSSSKTARMDSISSCVGVTYLSKVIKSSIHMLNKKMKKRFKYYSSCSHRQVFGISVGNQSLFLVYFPRFFEKRGVTWWLFLFLYIHFIDWAVIS